MSNVLLWLMELYHFVVKIALFGVFEVFQQKIELFKFYFYCKKKYD